jgi:cytoskeletal protein CcmA (bactofilin family)
MISNLINKFKKSGSEEYPIISVKHTSKHDLVSSDPILISDQINCNVYCSKEVIVDVTGEVKGNIQSQSCVVNGKVTGDIQSVDYIEVTNTAIIEGNIKSGSVQIEAGSVINGFVSIEKRMRLPDIIKKITGELNGKPVHSNHTTLHTNGSAPVSEVIQQAHKTEPINPPVINGSETKVIAKTVEAEKTVEKTDNHKVPLTNNNNSWW